jgi:farnesyl diphosphate synthase
MSTISPVPGYIVVVASVYLYNTEALSTVTDTFFALGVGEQIAICAILFALVFSCSNIAMFLGPPEAGGHAAHDHAPPPQYPLLEMEQCENDREKFMLMYPVLRDDILEHISQNLSAGDIPLNHECMQWMKEMVDYTVPGGKLNRGLTVIDVTRTLIQFTHGRDLTQHEIARASVLGWALEFLQAFFLVADDVMDESETRRGQPCWYKIPKVDIIAVNDSFLLESFVYTLLKRHFGSESYYEDLMELFLEVTQKTELGQLLDLTSQPMNGKGPTDLDRFTIERHALIVKYKTAFYTFYLPIAISMITAGIPAGNKEAYALASKICCIMGEYFQIQDDYLDCYGDPETIGKIGTDIQDNKCSWMVVQALDRATPEQKKLLKENYGQWDDAKVAKVKSLYNDLKLADVFHVYEEESYKRIQAELDKVELMPPEVFEVLLNRIYKRNK